MMLEFDSVQVSALGLAHKYADRLRPIMLSRAELERRAPARSEKASFLCLGRGGVGPDMVDFGPLPSPTRPRGGLGKGPGRGLARFAQIFSPVDQV